MSKPKVELIEHVYHPEKSPDDFQLIRIHMELNEDDGKLLISLESEIEMTDTDVENVLRYLEKAVLKRRKITIFEDCIVLVKMKQQQYKVSFEQSWSIQGLAKL